jgi:hypothetical protein
MERRPPDQPALPVEHHHLERAARERVVEAGGAPDLARRAAGANTALEVLRLAQGSAPSFAILAMPPATVTRGTGWRRRYFSIPPAKSPMSMLGTTGVVVPYSCAAWIDSIHRGVDVARAGALDQSRRPWPSFAILAMPPATVTRGTGWRRRYFSIPPVHGLPPQALIDMGDFAGGMLKYLRRHPVPRVTVARAPARATSTPRWIESIQAAQEYGTTTPVVPSTDRPPPAPPARPRRRRWRACTACPPRR